MAKKTPQWLKGTTPGRILSSCKFDTMEKTANGRFYQRWARYKTKKSASQEEKRMHNHPYMRTDKTLIQKSKCSGYNVYVSYDARED